MFDPFYLVLVEKNKCGTKIERSTLNHLLTEEKSQIERNVICSVIYSDNVLDPTDRCVCV